MSLASFIERHAPLFVLTGAGCSTEAGIPDYRDDQGAWKRAPPMSYQEFTTSHAARQRYWARGLIGWRRMREVAPGRTHAALARLEHAGHIDCLITQNVDGLHQRAGSRCVIDLHGRVDTVHCLNCGARFARERIQSQLDALNPAWPLLAAPAAPDGDVALTDAPFDQYRLVNCEHCGGALKPGVVFFGEAVPRQIVERAYAALARAEGVLVIGSSLMVYSGYRFVRDASERALPIAIINRGRTRADAQATIKIEALCGDVLEWLAARMIGAELATAE